MRFINLILIVAFFLAFIGCGSVGRSVKPPDVIPPPESEKLNNYNK
jgi:hypothetical protein